MQTVIRPTNGAQPASLETFNRSFSAAPGSAVHTAQSHWNPKTTPNADDAAIAAACGISPITAAILRERGYTTAAAVGQFFDPSLSGLHDPLQLPDVRPAIARLHRAITNKEPFLIFGDYDVDGVTSTALLTRSLRALGAVVTPRIPERQEGYGLTAATVEEAHAAGLSLILTADCGITANEAVARAAELGMDVIITDHHTPGAQLPPALAVINPKREDSAYGFRELCGCGVAFKTMQALMQEYWPRHADSFWDKYVELVGVAAIADCVPLVDENRILAREGLRRLIHTRKHGLQALIQSARLKVTGDTICGRQVSFGLAPRLNAAGRIDSAHKAFQLLMSTDAAECTALAAELEEHNKVRQETTGRVFAEASALVAREVDLERDLAIVVAGHGWPKGIVGLVASRLVEMHSRPAIVLGVDGGTAHGSGRSVDGFDLHAVIEASRDLILSGGGHRAACGLSLDMKRFAEFRERALQCAAEQLRVEDIVPSIEADCLVNGRDVTKQLAQELEKLEPCGTGNPEARLMLHGARIVDSRCIGSGGEHLKWQVEVDGRRFQAVWWKPCDRALGFSIGKIVDICFVPELNAWKDNVTLQLNIKEARIRQ